MRLKLKFIAATSSLLLFSQSYAYKDAEPAPMMAPANPIDVFKKKTASSRSVEKLNKNKIVEEFNKSYNLAKKPRVAFFWGRNLTSQISDWDAQSRLVGREVNNKNEGEISEIQLQRKKTTKADSRMNLDSVIASISEIFFNNNVSVMDRALIMRLTTSDKAKEKSTNELQDNQFVEIDALRGYADYLIEVNRTNRGSWENFTYSIKHIDSGRLLSQKVTSARPYVTKPKREIILTDSGYQYYTPKPKPVTLTDRGRRLGLEIMRSLEQNIQADDKPAS